MSKKKSKLDNLPRKLKSHSALSPLERSMMWVGSESEPIGTTQYYGSNGNENQSKVEGNRHG